MVAGFGDDADGVPVGICFPAIVHHGRTMSAANVSKKLDRTRGREALREGARPRHPLRQRRGCRRRRRGDVRRGEGRGRARDRDDPRHRDRQRLPLRRRAHPELRARAPPDRRATTPSTSPPSRRRNARTSTGTSGRSGCSSSTARSSSCSPPTSSSWAAASRRTHEEFLPLLTLATPIVPAELRNNAGILGAAWLAARSSHH